MTSTVPFATQPIGRPMSQGVSSLPAATVRLGLQQAKDHCFLCWMVAITSCFLAVGVIGVFEGSFELPTLMSGVKGDAGGDQESMEAVLADVQSQEVATEVAEEIPEEIELPTPVEVMEMPQELPDPIVALETEDVFVIPSAPRIETALRPVEPVPEKPKPKAVTKPTTRRGPVASSAPRGSGGPAASGAGTGGASTSGVSASPGSYSVPPIRSRPSHLKGRGMSGTVRVKIHFGTSGRVDDVSVVKTSGFSELDDFAASHARRNGRGPAGFPATKFINIIFLP